MRITKVYSVFCDVNGARCVGWVAETTNGVTAARREAKAAGWRRVRGVGDVCPACVDLIDSGEVGS